MIDPKDSFREIVANFVSGSEKHHELLRRQFSVSKPTVDRWASGAGAPCPTLCPIVESFILAHECRCVP
jgi:hypothetical protein